MTWMSPPVMTLVQCPPSSLVPSTPPTSCPASPSTSVGLPDSPATKTPLLVPISSFTVILPYSRRVACSLQAARGELARRRALPHDDTYLPGRRSDRPLHYLPLATGCQA